MKKILIVDDDSGLTTLLKFNIEATGLYEVSVENNARLALGAARKVKPDLIILDYIMPEMDGGDVMTAFQADHVIKNVPVIMLTALVCNRDTPANGYLETAGQKMLPKPVALDVLLGCLEEELMTYC